LRSLFGRLWSLDDDPIKGFLQNLHVVNIRPFPDER
jgi:hypothetical protein